MLMHMQTVIVTAGKHCSQCHAQMQCVYGAPRQGSLQKHCAVLQARDVEASLQEQLLEQFDELVLACAAKAGSAGRSQHAIAAAAEAATRLQPILAVLPAAGAAGMSCLGRACAALDAKKRLKGKAVAAGLQNIIHSSQDTPGDKHFARCTYSALRLLS